jgi:hypothetical protein
MGTGTFVYCVCGERHARTVETSIRFLKRASRADILVVAARTGPIGHDQVLTADVPAGLTDHQAAILLKTSLPRLVSTAGVACYLDSDQIAVSPQVDSIFALFVPPVTFAVDHVTLERFSRTAVRCGCVAASCDHLRGAIHEKFNVRIADPRWRHWNGGLFLFSEAASEFAARWHDYALLALEDPYWEVRDQGTLAATVWRLGLESHSLLPDRFNRIVDRYRGQPEATRTALSVSQYRVDGGYRLGAQPSPVFLHFINGGVGARGWRNWDDAEALLQRAAPTRGFGAC